MDESREELYRMVWAEPMLLLGPKLGISDVALEKRCAACGVPTPPRGYWAKLEAGKSVKKPPLPDSYSVQRKEKRLPRSADEVKKLAPSDFDYKLAKYPPPVLATKRSLHAARATYYGVLECLAKGALKTRVSSDAVDRALWL